MLGIQKIEGIQETRGGIYFIYNKKEQLMYIGKAINIRARLLQHIQGSFQDEVANNYHYADYILISKEMERDEAETRLINLLKPPLNRAKVKTYDSQYYSEELNPDYHKYKNYMEEVVNKALNNFNL